MTGDDVKKFTDLQGCADSKSSDNVFQKTDCLGVFFLGFIHPLFPLKVDWNDSQLFYICLWGYFRLLSPTKVCKNIVVINPLSSQEHSDNPLLWGFYLHVYCLISKSN